MFTELMRKARHLHAAVYSAMSADITHNCGLPDATPAISNTIMERVPVIPVSY
jgi:hypothetical protein